MERSHDFVARRLGVLLLLAACGLDRPANALDCPTGGLCVGALCVGGSSTPCPDDGVACTEERCDPVRGCVHEPVAARCEDGDPCTAAICDPHSGCTQAPATGPACEDGDACTTADRCMGGRCVGQPVRCPPDAWACTDEQCIAGVCRPVPLDDRCPAAECTVSTCRPGARDADRRGCVTTPSVDGTPCSDDGAFCTDDACDAGGCLHVPIDGRCASADECTQAVCAPERDDRNEAGCVPGSSDGPGCAEDGDPCSDDLCQESRCAHQPVTDPELCAPIRSAFRRALALGTTVRGLLRSVSEQAASRQVEAPALAERLGRLDADLSDAALMLAGRIDVPEEPRGTAETSAQQRARGAATRIARSPREARVLLRTLAGREPRAALGRNYAVALRRRMRELVRGIVALKLELARVQEVLGSFVR